MEHFLELYQTVYCDLYRLAYYYMGNAQDAEDAVQDAALSAYEHFYQLKKEAAFRSWIFSILVNRCKKILRKRGRSEVLAENPHELYGQAGSELDSQAEVLELLDTLGEEERLILTLRIFGGYKSEEVAEMLHRKHSTIRSKYRRALKKLEQELMREHKGKEKRR